MEQLELNEVIALSNISTGRYWIRWSGFNTAFTPGARLRSGYRSGCAGPLGLRHGRFAHDEAEDVDLPVQKQPAGYVGSSILF